MTDLLASAVENARGVLWIMAAGMVAIAILAPVDTRWMKLRPAPWQRVALVLAAGLLALLSLLGGNATNGTPAQPAPVLPQPPVAQQPKQAQPQPPEEERLAAFWEPFRERQTTIVLGSYWPKQAEKGLGPGGLVGTDDAIALTKIIDVL